MLTARRTEIWFKNASDQAQVLKHRLLEKMAAVPVIPGGFVRVVNGAITLQPGQAAKAPMALWNTTPCAMNLGWTQEISQEEFDSMIDAETTTVSVADYDAVKEQLAEATAKAAESQTALEDLLAESAEKHCDYTDAIDKALGSPRDLVEGDLLAQHLAAIKQLAGKQIAATGEASDGSDKSDTADQAGGGISGEMFVDPGTSSAGA
jgi:hypothetical protein